MSYVDMVAGLIALAVGQPTPMDPGPPPVLIHPSQPGEIVWRGDFKCGAARHRLELVATPYKPIRLRSLTSNGKRLAPRELDRINAALQPMTEYIGAGLACPPGVRDGAILSLRGNRSAPTRGGHWVTIEWRDGAIRNLFVSAHDAPLS